MVKYMRQPNIETAKVTVWKDLQQGMEVNLPFVVERKDMEVFAKLSGDFSPIHMDDEYAKSTKFKGRVVHGMLLASFLSRMVGMYIPGKHALYTSQSLEFPHPCFIDDEITVSSVVIDKSQSTKIIKIESKITNKKNEILLNGVGRIIVRDD